MRKQVIAGTRIFKRDNHMPNYTARLPGGGPLAPFNVNGMHLTAFQVHTWFLNNILKDAPEVIPQMAPPKLPLPRREWILLPLANCTQH